MIDNVVVNQPAPPATDAAPQTDAGPFAPWVDDFGLNDAETVETPLPDAATSAAVEPPKQAATADVPAKVEEPAKPAEAAPAVADQPVPPATDKPADKPAEAPAPEAAAAKPEETPGLKDDPELSAEENELIRTRPEAEQPGLRDRFKKASFINQFKDPEVPAAGTVEALRKISPSSAARLEAEIIGQRLAEPTKFLDEVFTRDPEAYGKLMADGFRSDPGYFVKQLTGREDLKPEDVRTAVDFYERNKDRVVEQPAIKELTPEQLADAKLYLGDEAVATIEALQARAKEVAAAPPPPVADKPAPTAPKAEVVKDPAKPETAEPKPAEKQLTPEQLQAQTVQREQTWDKASGQIESYLETWVDDPTNGLGLKVTPQERELAPEVADLKDYKRKVFFEGLGDLPDFRTGLSTWGKERPEFVKALGLAVHFADLGEEANAIEAARALLPFVEKYKQERMQAPIFARLDAQRAAATTRTNPKTENDAIIPGAVVASSPQQNSDPNRRIDDLLLNDAMSG